MKPEVTSLSADDKRKLLETLLRSQPRPAAGAPLSFGQERLWDFQSLDPISPVYNVSLAYRLTGPLDPGALERAIRAVVDRHESLRTTFSAADGRRVRVVSPLSEVTLNRVDIPGSAVADWTATADRQARADASIPFDLGRGPCHRFTLLRRSGGEHVLVVTIHHIVCDRWSLGLIAQEIGAFYAADVGGGPGLAPAGTYSAFVDWERQNLRDDVLGPQLAAWEERLRGAPAELHLPTGRRSNSGSVYRGGREEFTLDAALVGDLRALALADGVTLYAVMLAGFAALLLGRTGQDDLVVCTPVSGRHRSVTKGVVGYFNNILPLRLDLSDRPDFRALVRRVALEAKWAYGRQDTPLQRILGLPGLGRSNLTRCLFSLQNTHSLALRLPGVVSDYHDVRNGTSNFDLSLFLEEKSDALVGLVDYKSDLFGAEAIRRLAVDYEATLRDLLREPERPLAGGPAPGLAPPHAGDAAAPDSAATGPGPGPRPVPPVNELERQLVRVWEDVLGVQPLDTTSHFFDLGGNSFMAARLIARVEAMLGRELPLAMMLKAPTVGQFTRLLADEGWMPSWGSLVPIRTEGSRPPFYCVHGGGGGVISFRRLAMYLDPDQPIWGLQSMKPRPGEEFNACVESMAKLYLEAVLDHQPEGPYLLGGHSFGAIVAFEMAQRLRADGREVALLAVIDYPGPASRATRGDKLRWHWIVLGQLGPKDKWRYLSQALTWKLRTSPKVPRFLKFLYFRLIRRDSPATSSRSLKTIQASLSALGSYQIRPYPGRLTLFRATEGMQAIHCDPFGGWGETALGGVEVHDIPGQHMDMLAEPSVQTLAAALRAALGRVPAPTEAPGPKPA